MKLPEKLAQIALVAALASCGCKGKGEPSGGPVGNESADGVVFGVRYHLDLQGSYRMVQRTEREQVWIPSDDDRPFVAIQVSPRPRRDGDIVQPCFPGENDGTGKAYGAFFYVRQGDSVALKSVPAPHGVNVSTDRCLPPGEQALSCSASYVDGEMPAERESQALSACKSLVVR